jgi:hypothetical protein
MRLKQFNTLTIFYQQQNSKHLNSDHDRLSIMNITLYYSPSCPICQNVLPMWNAFKHSITNEIIMTEYSDASPEMVEQQITILPTMIVTFNGVSQVHTGPNILAELVPALQQYSSSVYTTNVSNTATSSGSSINVPPEMWGPNTWNAIADLAVEESDEETDGKWISTANSSSPTNMIIETGWINEVNFGQGVTISNTGSGGIEIMSPGQEINVVDTPLTAMYSFDNEVVPEYYPTPWATSYSHGMPGLTGPTGVMGPTGAAGPPEFSTVNHFSTQAMIQQLAEELDELVFELE